MRSEFALIQQGFDKMPALTAGTAVIVNPGGTGLTNTVGQLALAGNFTTTGAFSTTLAAQASVTITLPTTSAVMARTDSAQTFTGTQTFGAIIASTLNGLSVTSTTGTLTVAAGKTLTQSNTLTYTGTDGSTVNFGAGGTVAYTASSVASITGTANQITASASTGAVTLSLPAAVTMPGSLTVTSTLTYPTPFTLGATSVTSTGAQLNYLNAATGTTGTTSTNLVFSGAPTFTTSITTPSVLASSNGSGSIGASGTAFSNLFLASGGVINWNAGNYTITHSAGLLTTSGALTIAGALAGVTTLSMSGALSGATTGAFSSTLSVGSTLTVTGAITGNGSSITASGDGGSVPIKLIINDVNASGRNFDWANAASAFGSLYLRVGTSNGAAPSQFLYAVSSGGLHQWFQGGSEIARLELTNPGLRVGTTGGTFSSAERLSVTATGAMVGFGIKGDTAGTTVGGFWNAATSGTRNQVWFADGVGGATRGKIQTDGTNLLLDATTGAFIHTIAGVEVARIDSAGSLLVGVTASVAGTTHVISAGAAGKTAGYWQHTHASNPIGLQITYTAASPNGTSNWFFYGSDSGGERASLRSNGGLANYSANNVNLSDATAKRDFRFVANDPAMARALWDAHKQVDWNFHKYNDQTHDDENFGYTAQGVAKAFADVAPWIVDNSFDGGKLCVYSHDLFSVTGAVVTILQVRTDDHEARLRALEGKLQ